MKKSLDEAHYTEYTLILSPRMMKEVDEWLKFEAWLATLSERQRKQERLKHHLKNRRTHKVRNLPE